MLVWVKMGSCLNCPMFLFWFTEQPAAGEYEHKAYIKALNPTANCNAEMKNLQMPGNVG
jgi:hypothetical protein